MKKFNKLNSKTSKGLTRCTPEVLSGALVTYKMKAAWSTAPNIANSCCFSRHWPVNFNDPLNVLVIFFLKFWARISSVWWYFRMPFGAKRHIKMHLLRIHRVEPILENSDPFENTFSLILCYLGLFCKNNFLKTSLKERVTMPLKFDKFVNPNK